VILHASPPHGGQSRSSGSAGVMRASGSGLRNACSRRHRGPGMNSPAFPPPARGFHEAENASVKRLAHNVRRDAGKPHPFLTTGNAGQPATPNQRASPRPRPSLRGQHCSVPGGVHRPERETAPFGLRAGAPRPAVAAQRRVRRTRQPRPGRSQAVLKRSSGEEAKRPSRTTSARSRTQATGKNPICSERSEAR
jgi:hypothetical protein